MSRVLSLDAANSFAKAGLMFRAGTAANAATVILDTRPDGNIEFMARLCTGCAMQFLGTAKVTLPPELILINDSGHFTASVSQTDSAHARRSGRLMCRCRRQRLSRPPWLVRVQANPDVQIRNERSCSV